MGRATLLFRPDFLGRFSGQGGSFSRRFFGLGLGLGRSLDFLRAGLQFLGWGLGFGLLRSRSTLLRWGFGGLGFPGGGLGFLRRRLAGRFPHFGDLGPWFVLRALLLAQTEGPGSASSFGLLQGPRLDARLQRHFDASVDLVDLRAHLVVGQDKLQDGLARRATPFLQLRDSVGDHGGVFGVLSHLGAGLSRLGDSSPFLGGGRLGLRSIARGPVVRSGRKTGCGSRSNISVSHGPVKNAGEMTQ